MDMIGQVHAPVALLHIKEPRYSMDRRLGEPQSRSGRCGEKKSCPVRIQTRVTQLVA
jgi:hypothetical protein